MMGPWDLASLFSLMSTWTVLALLEQVVKFQKR